MNLKLMIKSKAQYQAELETTQNFVIKLNGSRNVFSSLIITNDAKNQLFHLQTKIFHNINLRQKEIFEINSEIIQ